jgi:2-oxoglutarate ferredoxin oxidoreductase subunit gamma
LVGISQVVSAASLEKAVLSRVPKGTEQLNLTALKYGLELAEEGKKYLEE